MMFLLQLISNNRHERKYNNIQKKVTDDYNYRLKNELSTYERNI